MAAAPAGQQPSSERLGELLGEALSSGSDEALRSTLLRHSGLPGPRMSLTLVDRFADVVADIVRPTDPAAATVDVLEGLLDRWAAMSAGEAPGDRPEVVLPCSAVASYGAVGAVRPAWWVDETTKLRRAASDSRWRVREMVAAALQRVLEVDWERTVAELARWAADADPLVVRAAAAAVAAEGDFSLLGELVRSEDADLRWVARENLEKRRLARWPEDVAGLRSELERVRP